jgi:hypothetical protein
VFGIEEDLFAFFFEKPYRFADALQILIQGGREHVGDVKIPRLPENAHAGCIRREERLHVGVALHRNAFSPRAAEGDELRMPKLEP